MRSRSKHGYILIETTVAIVVLGISAITIQGVVRQAIQTRGQVQDFTHVRFLMEDYMARLELQPYVFAGIGDGVFEEGAGRFRYTYEIRPVNVPVPDMPIPDGLRPEELTRFTYESRATYLVHVGLTVRWTRGQMDFEETIETLLPQAKLYVPPRPDRGER
jgi:type II secretory pathway pseudopilin PulG